MAKHDTSRKALGTSWDFDKKKALLMEFCSFCRKKIKGKHFGSKLEPFCSNKCKEKHGTDLIQVYKKAEKLKNCFVCKKPITGKGMPSVDIDRAFRPMNFCSVKCFDNWEPE